MAFLDEIAARLVAQGVGTLSVGLASPPNSIFVSTAVDIPPGNGPYLTIVDTGGTAPTRAQNQAGAKTQRPTAQIFVRAKAYPVANAMARAAYNALDGIFNTTLSGTIYLSITARQEPTDIGLDAAKRAMVAFNIDAEKRPS